MNENDIFQAPSYKATGYHFLSIQNQSKLSLKSFKADRYFWTIYDQISALIAFIVTTKHCAHDKTRSVVSSQDIYILALPT